MHNRKQNIIKGPWGDNIETSQKQDTFPNEKYLTSKPFKIFAAIYLSLGAYDFGQRAINKIFPAKQPTKIQNKLTEAEIEKRERKLHPEAFWEARENLEKRLQVPTFQGYESEQLKIYDNTIIQARNFWNNYLKNEQNYTQPSLEDIKKILLIETAYKGTPVSEFFTDPMQVVKGGAYDAVTEIGNEGFFPENGVQELKNLNLTQAEQSIYTGVGWYIHKSAKYDYNKKKNKRFIKSMDYSKGHKKYNGGGDPNYKTKINSLKQRKNIAQTKQNHYKKAQ